MNLFSTEINAIQRTVKNLNARISRIRNTKGDDTQYILDEMIARLPQTRFGGISASIKNIEAMSKRELRDYLSELESIQGFLDSRKLIREIENDGSFNPEDIWRAVDYAREKGTPPDSGTVKSIVDALTDNPNNKLFLDSIINIFEVSSGRIGVGEFAGYYEELNIL